MVVKDKKRRKGGVGGEMENKAVEEERNADNSEISGTKQRRRKTRPDNDGDTATGMNDPSFSLPPLPFLSHLPVSHSLSSCSIPAEAIT